MKTKYWLDGANGEFDFGIIDGHLSAKGVEHELGLKAGSVIDTEWHHVDEQGEPEFQD